MLAMTPELIDLEFVHMEIDEELRKKSEGGGKNFEDNEFDEWEENSENFDSKLSDNFTSEDESGDKDPVTQGSFDDDPEDWEEVD